MIITNGLEKKWAYDTIKYANGVFDDMLGKKKKKKKKTPCDITKYFNCPPSDMLSLKELQDQFFLFNP